MVSTARKFIDWSKVNWKRSNADLARHFGVTKQNVAYARGKHSPIASPAGHGGKRKGAGRKPVGS